MSSEFPDAFIFLRVQKPTGPTRGTAFDHIGFAVPNVPATGDEAGGERLSGDHRPRAEAGSGGRRRRREPPAVYGRFAYLLGPDGAKIELVTSDDKTRPAHQVSPHPLHQQAVRRDAAVVHESVRRDAASGPDRLLHWRRPAGRRLQPELLSMGRRPDDHPRAHRRPRRRSRGIRSEEPGRVLQEARGEGHQADGAVQQGPATWRRRSSPIRGACRSS